MLCLICFWRMSSHVLQFALLLFVCDMAVHLDCSHRDGFHFQIPHLRPAEYKRSRLSRNRRTVNRPYGGVLSGTAVRERLENSFSTFGFDNPKVANLLTCLCNPTCLQDHPCFPGWRAEDCQEGVETTEDQRQDFLKVTLKQKWSTLL
jgi:hypothetical protein